MSSLDRNNGWCHLPSEILSATFEEVESSTYTFWACQLVCKGWSKAAEERLYQHVHLDSTNVNQFINAIQDSPTRIGDVVKIISFTTGHALNTRLYEILDVIVRYCPKVEMCYAERPKEDDFDGEQYGVYDQKKQELDMLFYAAFALHADELDEIEDNSESSRSNMDCMKRELALLHIQLEQFTALKTIYFISCRIPDLGTFDRLIDRCSPNVHTVYFLKT